MLTCNMSNYLKDLMEDFVVVGGSNASASMSSAALPTIDLDVNTQEIISPKRSPSPEGGSGCTVLGRKKKLAPKMKKDNI